MAKDSNEAPETPSTADPLSATAMFLRALDKESGNKPEGVKDPDAIARIGDVLSGPDTSAHASSRSSANASPTSEFSQLFPASGSGHAHVEPPTPISTAPVESRSYPKAEPPAARNELSGEFTRIFVKPSSSSSSPSSKSEAESAPPKPFAPANPSFLKGFSSPGSSDAVSTQSSFTQFFKASSQSSEGGRNSPESSASPGHAAANSAPSWSSSPAGRSPEWTRLPGDDSASVTSLINSLSSPAERGSERPVAYRPEPVPSPYSPPSAQPVPSDLESGGVTRILQRLSQEPPARATPVTPAETTPTPSASPGESTRIISPMGARSASSVPAAPAAPVQVAPVAMPAMPAIAHPVAPAMPAVAPPPPVAAVPVVPAVPAVPKPAAPTAPAVAAPKGKLEAIVPILLVINTFLLLVLLLAVAFLIKTK